MNHSESLQSLLETGDIRLDRIAEKVIEQKRIDDDEALYMFEHASVAWLGSLANFVKHRWHGKKVFFNRNFHLEPTNLCVFDCKFCSYSRSFKERPEAWEMTYDEMLNTVKSFKDKNVTEIHIVGGVHPKMNLPFYEKFFRDIKSFWPDLHIKAFTAVEYEYMFRKAEVSYEEGFRRLIDAGLDSIPGGGAEIFHPEIRQKICADKCTAEQWLAIHETAHRLGLHSNATMLYGHIENYFHRVHHMSLLRHLQDQTGGFNCFIPLKFRNQNNEMSHIPETTLIDDVKTYAIARIYFDNIPHIKAYWPMLGRQSAQLLLSFGVDDIDGTIDDTTKIYSMAGSEEQHPAMSTTEIVQLIESSGFEAVERDSLYHEILNYSHQNNEFVS